MDIIEEIYFTEGGRIVKRYLVILLVIVMSVVTGCGNSTKKPEGFTDDQYEAAQRLLEVYDEYLDAKITSEEFEDKCDILAGRLQEPEDSEEYNSDLRYIESCASMVHWSIDDMKELQENRDAIQKILNGED